MSRQQPTTSDISVSAAPGAAAAAIAWRQDGRLFVTVLVKATFRFVQDGPMKRTAPQDVVRRDVHHGDSPARSVRVPSDLAPWLLRADVTLNGHAHVPASGIRTVPVRFGVFSNGTAVLDKTVLVHDEAGVGSVPLVFERAFGGVGCEENPLGVGAGEGSQRPALLDPSEPARTACFAPVGRAWPTRRRLLGATPRKQIEAPIPDIPEGFDWRYFQAAPRDQQVGYLRGDEWIVIDGVHPTLPRVRTRLPGARGIAKVYGLAGSDAPEGEILVLRADTVRIEAADEECTVVWRNRFAVADEAALAALHVVAGVELPDEPIAWPEPVRAIGAGAGAADEAREEPSPTSTLFLADSGPRSARAVMPFRPGEGRALQIPSPPPRPPDDARPACGRTITLSPDEEALVNERSLLPFSAPPPPPDPGSAAPAGRLAPPPPALPADLAAPAAAPPAPAAGKDVWATPPAEAPAAPDPLAARPRKAERPKVAVANPLVKEGLYARFAAE